MPGINDDDLPSYRDLLAREEGPAGSAWGLWGQDDLFGALNLLTPERVRAAAALVRQGHVFALNWDLNLPNPGFGVRGKPRHALWGRADYVRDDLLDNFYLQGSSHWDAFSHFGHPDHGFFGGVRPDEIHGGLGSRHGIEHFAARGLAGRGVLLDVGRWFAAQGRTFDYNASTPITVADLEGTRRAQGVELRVGDVLLVRTGWMAHYLAQPQEWRTAIARDIAIPGLAAGPEMIAYLWDHHVAAVAADNYSVEVYPFPDLRSSLHVACLGLLGIPLGEFWDLEALAAGSARDGVYDCLLTSAPLHQVGGTASPPNALAIK